MPTFIEAWPGSGRVVTPSSGRSAETRAYSCMYVSTVLTSPDAQFKGLGVLLGNTLHCLAAVAGCRFLHLHALKALVGYYADCWLLSETTKGIFPCSNLDDTAVRPMVRIVDSSLAALLDKEAKNMGHMAAFFEKGMPAFTELDRIKAENNRATVVSTWKAAGFQGFDVMTEGVIQIHTFLTYKRSSSAADLFRSLVKDLEKVGLVLTEAQGGRIKSIRKRILHLRGTYDDDDRPSGSASGSRSDSRGASMKRSRSDDGGDTTEAIRGFGPVHIDLSSSTVVESLRLQPASSSSSSSSSVFTLTSSESLLIHLWPKDQLQTAIDAFKFEAARGSGQAVLEALLLKRSIVTGER